MGGYCIQQILSWYQKKIGTYDKQQWEKTLEQKILSGFTHVPKKIAKLKPELIDVDLVRGSSFTKAKSKEGLATVMRLALLRLLFLPFYARWWSHQTSPKLFVLLLTLYMFQIVNMCLYYYSTHYLPEDAIENVSASEVIVPVAMMLFLCILHSEIVSPHSSHKEFTKYTNKISNNNNSKRSKRTKRRIRTIQSFDFKLSPDTCSENKTTTANDSSAKFTNRHHRGRKLSFEEGMMKVNSAQRSWTGSSLPAGGNQHQSPSLPLPVTLVSNGGVERREEEEESAGRLEEEEDDDEGFESLNSNTSSDHQTSAQAVLQEAVVQANGNTNTAQQTGDIKQIGAPEKKRLFYPPKRVPSKSEKLKNLRCGGIKDAMSSGETDHKDSDTDNSDQSPSHTLAQMVQSGQQQQQRLLNRRRGSQQTLSVKLSASVSAGPSEECINTTCDTGGAANNNCISSSYNSSDYDVEDEDEDEDEGGNKEGSSAVMSGAASSSTAEWIGLTTNSDDCSDIDDIPTSLYTHDLNDHPFASEFQLLSPTVILSPSCAASDKVSCTMWEKREVKKAELSVLDISSAIIARVETMPENLDYFYGGMLVSILLGMVPSLYRLTEVTSTTPSTPLAVLPQPGGGGSSVLSLVGGSSSIDMNMNITGGGLFPELFLFVPYSVASLRNLNTVSNLTITIVSSYAASFLNSAFGTNVWERSIAVIALLERSVLSGLYFFLIAIAERTFKQRFLYAKFFSHLTSFRRARKSQLPHFRLNKVRNIKTWLSVRSYLKKRGPQHSVDVIVSSVFLITLLLLSFLSVELLKDSERLHSMYNIEALVWCIVLGLFLLRFMTLGTKINRKYRNLSVLITEQINLYLQIEQKPNKKEELMVANSVLKLAADLLKELECPYKISGLSANPYLYTITKVVILSALSGVLSEMLGFKLKLHKIKIK